MAATYHGFGFIHYGKRDFDVDDSYVTTLWFAVAYVPVVPIRSLRIRETGGTSYISMRRRRNAVILAKMPPNWQQVVSVYAFFAVEVGLLVLADARLSPDSQRSWGLRIMALLLLGFPILLRKRALEHVRAEKARAEAGFAREFQERGSAPVSFRD
jgi:hypothetical protein